ncbi:MAG: sodium:proton antiporter NhaD [Bacteroidaceae bacterium]|nr:sodium:proton antiporter NhaD [Bacteroidaceae bacterium]
MKMITSIIVAVFVIGYACIALEHGTKINKAPVALLMCAICWTLLTIGVNAGTILLPHGEGVTERMLHHLAETCEIIVFLMGAMTIVEIVDANGGFNFVKYSLQTSSKRKLMWRMMWMTFFLSAVLDNLTTSIVMIMVLRKLVHAKEDRLLFAGLIILAANAGGAFSPIGDVTTIMLWVRGMLSTTGVITEVFLPSVMSLLIPCLIMHYRLKGNLEDFKEEKFVEANQEFSEKERKTVFFLGVGGLLFVPIFKSLTHLAPYVGILLVLGVLWTVVEVFLARKKNHHLMSTHRVTNMLQKIDMTTILFFLGILMTVATLQDTGVLTAFGEWLNEATGSNYYAITGVIGAASAIVDNVPLVAGCMGMYPIEAAGALAQDGIFWQLLAYCAGVGGSMLIIGSAAGVVVMGLENISFGWYLKNISLLALAGYLAGIAVYAVQHGIFVSLGIV